MTEENQEIESQEEVESPEVEETEEEETESEEENQEIEDESSSSQEESHEEKEWIKHLRKTYKETQKENRELKEKLQTYTATENKPVQLGAKPTLEDVDYDTDLFESELTKWYDRKREVEQLEAKKRQEQEEQNKAWASTLEKYAKEKDELRLKDYDEAEFMVEQNLSSVQQGIILQSTENPAIGRSPEKAKELAQITDPLKFAYTIGRMELEMKNTINKKTPPAPEKVIKGSGSLSGVTDATLKRLEEEADRTGDRTKVVQYKKKLRQQ